MRSETGVALTHSAAGKMPTVGIVGGGLAGLAAAVRLAEAGLHVEIFESRSRLGGRAGSFLDPATGEWIDYCQHVGMGCCTNLADFCQRLNLAAAFRRFDTLHFFGPTGRRFDFRGSRWLPAPLHLAQSLMGLGFLSWRERIGIARSMLRLARTPAVDSPDGVTIGEWLARQHQTPGCIERFWSVILVSALGESLDQASLAAARQVFVDGFLSNRTAYHVDVPQRPLAEMFGVNVENWFRSRGVRLHLGSEAIQLRARDGRVSGIELRDGSLPEFDFYVAALPWRRVAGVLPADVLHAIPELASIGKIEPSPITGVHLWFDRSWTDLPHAVLVGRLSQWLFNRGPRTAEAGEAGTRGHYYQVVISASRNILDRERQEVLDEVLSDLRTIWPAARAATLRHWRIVTDREAVFSCRPGLQSLRPTQCTPIPNLFLAGDWTRTGWPATMESAVRSGYLAAQGVLSQIGHERDLLAPDLPRGALTRWLLGS